MTNGVIDSILSNTSVLGAKSNTSSVSNLSNLSGLSSTKSAAATEEKDFAAILQDAIVNSLNETQGLIDNAEKAEMEFAMGQADNTNQLTIAQSKASLAVSYTVAVRDRMLEAYKEIMNMQI